jgi:hypothetical protein
MQFFLIDGIIDNSMGSRISDGIIIVDSLQLINRENKKEHLIFTIVAFRCSQN